MLFLGILLIQCKIRRGRPSDTEGDWPVGQPWSISVFKLHFLWL